ncbi:PREDICTED: uncharacterized protein LOC109192464 [Ipomoea nil]|uniref:uncharacterized protein LOC109192464 n=1 Tax=Ipomoea nil TaxID=35883 RepID=UPI0009018A03|nr:PREDICTED: uncharacterized protein LOC109192464 [Ipomoea nil]XP_019198663.1 PREDICTED: uncharacterized protein LOC109192464 [Ipomoea nil]
MNCVNVNPCILAYPPIAPSRSAAPATNPGFPVSLRLNKSSSIYTVAGLRKFSLKATASTSTYRQSAPVCLFGGKKSGSGDQAAPKEALENLLGSFKKEQSIEDLLRQQIKKQEFFDDGGTGGGGLGGGGGGSGGGSGGSEDENTSDELDEIFQVTMATLGFIYTYIYILRGEEIGRYIRDIIRYYIFRGRKSIRLTKLLARLNKHWTIIKGKYGNRLTDDEMDEVEGHLLTHLVKKTGTWYYRPKQAQKKVEKRAIVDPVYGEEYYEDDDEYYY